MSAVRPEYGPSLPALLGPRRTRIVLIAFAALLVVAAAARAVGGGTGLTDVLVREPVAFTLGFDGAKLRRAEPPAGAVLRLETRPGDPAPQSFTVRPLQVPPHRGAIDTAWLDLSSKAVAELQRRDGSFAYREEGRARIQRLPGYVLTFQTKDDRGRVVYGRRYWLVPEFNEEDGDPQPTQALVIDLRSTRSKAIVNAQSVGLNGPLKAPLRSLRFGTERP